MHIIQKDRPPERMLPSFTVPRSEHRGISSFWLIELSRLRFSLHNAGPTTYDGLYHRQQYESRSIRRTTEVTDGPLRPYPNVVDFNHNNFTTLPIRQIMFNCLLNESCHSRSAELCHR